MNKNIIQPHSSKVVNLIFEKVNNFQTDKIFLSDRDTFSQYQTIQDNITHQNHGFLTDLAPGQEDDRESYDIITPMIETAVANTDLDTDNIDTYTDNSEYLAHEYFSKAAIKRYVRQTNQGIVLNEMIYQFYDDGNIIVRRVEDNGEIFRPVLPQNILIFDQSARTLEDTDLAEKQVMNQTEVRSMKGWGNIDLLFDLCNTGDSDFTPYYEIYYYYGELSKKRLGNVKKEVHGINYKYQKGDNNEFVHSVIAVAKAKKGAKDEKGEEVQGIIVFAEELKPQIIHVTKKLKIKRYKPYESVRLGKYNGRFWGAGYREIGRPYQNRANELGNQIREIMKLASKMVFWSTDDEIAGSNILSDIENGQILKVKDLQLLNNVFPNLSLYAEEWNRNINEAQKALKAFEAASGESLPSNASATAVVTQSAAVGKFFDFKRERFGLFLSIIYKRWVLPDLLKDLTEEEAIELTGDASFIDEMVEYYIKGHIYANEMLATAIAGGTAYKEEFEAIKQMKKEELMKNPKLYALVSKEFFKDVEIFVGINVTGEGFNKQSKITNLLKMLEYEMNPNIAQNPDALDDLNEVRQMLGLRVKKNRPVNQALPMSLSPMPNGNNLPMKEESAVPVQSVKPNML